MSFGSSQGYTHYIWYMACGGRGSGYCPAYFVPLYTRFAQTFTHFQWEQDKVKQIHRENYARFCSVLFQQEDEVNNDDDVGKQEAKTKQQ